ncbi:MAG: hypothetical protein ACLGHG_07380 [Gammaproteobacteria bacterium]
MLNLRKSLVAWALLLAFMSAPAVAAEGGVPLARDVTIRLALIFMDGIMVVYDESAPEYRERVRKGMTDAEDPVRELIAEVGKKDEVAAAGMTDNWRIVQGALLGGDGFGDGVAATGYDARVHADFDNNMQRLLQEIEKVYGLRRPAAPIEVRAHVMAARVVAGYVKVAGAPFGAYTDSFNTGEEDLETQVGRVDKALVEMVQKYGKDKARAAQLRVLGAKWQFIRTTILKSGSQSTPFIVYKHGGDIIRGLAEYR